MVLAAGGWPGWHAVAWVTAAMVGARTCAMATNRVVDRWIDAANPRTAARHLPRGLLRVGEVRALAIGGALLLLVAAWRLNPLCLALAPLALVFLVGYNYTKRFTWTSHWILGFTDGIAAAGGWSALRGRLARGGRAARLRALAREPGRPLPPRCRLLQRQRLHRGDRPGVGRRRALVVARTW